MFEVLAAIALATVRLWITPNPAEVERLEPVTFRIEFETLPDAVMTDVDNAVPVKRIAERAAPVTVEVVETIPVARAATFAAPLAAVLLDVVPENTLNALQSPVAVVLELVVPVACCFLFGVPAQAETVVSVAVTFRKAFAVAVAFVVDRNPKDDVWNVLVAVPVPVDVLRQVPAPYQCVYFNAAAVQEDEDDVDPAAWTITVKTAAALAAVVLVDCPMAFRNATCAAAVVDVDDDSVPVALTSLRADAVGVLVLVDDPIRPRNTQGMADCPVVLDVVPVTNRLGLQVPVTFETEVVAAAPGIVPLPVAAQELVEVIAALGE